MQKRSDRYRDTSEEIESKSSRVQKNHLLYDEMNNKIGFEEIPSFNGSDQINLSSLDMDNLKRGEYQKVKDYKDLFIGFATIIATLYIPLVISLLSSFKENKLDLIVFLKENLA